VVSIRHVLEGTHLLNLGADNGETGAGSTDHDGSVGQDGHALTVIGGQLADGGRLSVVKTHHGLAVQQRVPASGTEGQGGDGVSFDKGIARVQVEKALPRPDEQHRRPTYTSQSLSPPARGLRVSRVAQGRKSVAERASCRVVTRMPEPAGGARPEEKGTEENQCGHAP
jgi:hypothetical protein